MSRTVFLGGICVCILAICGSGRSSAAQSPYRVIDLGAVSPNAPSEAFTINDAERVVGWVGAHRQKRATAWTSIRPRPQAMSLWGNPNDNSIAYVINSSNESVGWAGSSGGAATGGLPRLFPSTTLGAPNVEGRAYSANAATVAVGWSYLLAGGSNQKAVFFNNGRPIAAGRPVGAPFDLGNFGTDNSRAYDVNRAMHVVGAAATAAGPSHAFRHVGISRLNAGDDLGTLGGLQSEAASINDSDQVAGWSDVKHCGTGAPTRHAFLWQRGSMQDLGTPYKLPVVLKDPGGALRTVRWASTKDRAADGDGGHSISNRQIRPRVPQLVGYSELYYLMQRPATVDTDSETIIVGRPPRDTLCIPGNTGSFHRAWMWDGRMHDLNDMIPQNSGWYLLEAWGVNNHGQIVGRGLYRGRIHAYALLP